MLTALSIRDIILIDRLDLTFGPGLTVLTGETGAGKSVLLDSLGLALGARGDAGLVSRGAERGMVTAAFELPRGHAAVELLQENGLDIEGELVVRRIQMVDGRTRATVNDQPISISLLRQVAAMMAEIHGQHDDRALVDVSNHRRLLDAYAGLDEDVHTLESAFSDWKARDAAVREQVERLDRAEAERAYLQHAVDEFEKLAPQADEEDVLAERRALMMNAETFAGALREAVDVLTGDGVYQSSINAVLRRLERRAPEASGRLDSVVAALDRVVSEMAEAEAAIEAAQRDFQHDPQELENIEARLFALRAMARKHQVQVAELPAVRQRLIADLDALEHGAESLRAAREQAASARDAYMALARDASARRREAARALDNEVMAELAPLKLERACFITAIETDEDLAGPHGMDRIAFTVATNPGSEPGPLMKVASGGELARFMLALKVVLAQRGSAPTLIFDEIDTGVGGAVADAIGVRLARLAGTLQVLAVTHSPQVAARARAHMLVTKLDHDAARDGGEQVVTRVAPLEEERRREEIARMLSGAVITDEARAQADRLMTSGR